MKGMIFQMKKLIKKPIIIVLILFLIVLMIYFFINKNNKLFNKNFNIGNNITNKSIQEIEEYILNISSYEAKLEVTVQSNKNTNKYILKQKYINSKLEEQVVVEPSNIEGLTILYENGKLTINNTKLNLQTVYDNYEEITQNNLWLNSFIEEYKNNNNRSISEDSNYVIMTVNTTNNYEKVETLYIDKNTGNPEKMIIQDKNQKNMVYILYNEIRINNLSK